MRRDVKGVREFKYIATFVTEDNYITTETE